MADEPQVYEGWAIVELMGHSQELGYVTTKYFGNQAMFQIDSPEIPEREVILLDGCYVMQFKEYAERGSRVKKARIPAKSRIVSSKAIYAINPSTEQDVTGLISGDGAILSIVEHAQEDPDRMPF